MPTLTARLKLIKAALTDTVDVVGFLDQNFDLLDGLVPNTLCTAASRPASPFDGQIIWEADRDVMRVWSDNSSRWVQLNPQYLLSTDARPSGAFLGDRLFETDTGIMRVWDGTRYKPLGLGNVYYSQVITGDFNINSNPQVGITAQSFTADGNTPYEFEYYMGSWYVTAGAAESNQINVNIEESVNGGGSWAAVQTLPVKLGLSLNSQSVGPVICRLRKTPTSGAKMYRVTCTVNNTTSTVNNGPTQISFFKITEQ